MYSFLCKSLVLGMVLAGCRYSFAQNVAVTTDKQAYRLGEKIGVTVLNGLAESVYSIAASSTPAFAISNVERRFSRWSWDAYRITCQGKDCDIDFEGPAEIAPQKSATFVWEPRIYVDKQYKALHPGSWRLTLIYQLRKREGPEKWTWRTVKSNEFTVE